MRFPTFLMRFFVTQLARFDQLLPRGGRPRVSVLRQCVSKLGQRAILQWPQRIRRVPAKVRILMHPPRHQFSAPELSWATTG